MSEVYRPKTIPAIVHHGIICQGNAQVLTTISSQSKGNLQKKKKKCMSIIYFYCTLYLIYLGDNGIFSHFSLYFVMIQFKQYYLYFFIEHIYKHFIFIKYNILGLKISTPLKNEQSNS